MSIIGSSNRNADLLLEGRVQVQPLGSDDIYIADVLIGNPPQVLKMALDTGSSDL